MAWLAALPAVAVNLIVGTPHEGILGFARDGRPIHGPIWPDVPLVLVLLLNVICLIAWAPLALCAVRAFEDIPARRGLTALHLVAGVLVIGGSALRLYAEMVGAGVVDLMLHIGR